MSDANLQAVFFDFDGVICQTEVCRLDALEVRLHALGLHPDRRGLYRMVSGGLGSREAAMDALLGSQPLYWQHREEVLARHPIRFCYPQLLTPGLPEVLHTLHSAGLVLAVVSNSSVEVVDGALQQCGIRPYFQQIFSGWQIPQCKPDPYLYRQAMQAFGLSPETCLVVEDSPVGIRAGRGAGLPVAALRDRDGLIDQSEADGAMRDALSMLDRAAAAGAVDEETVTAALGVMGQDDGVHLAEHFKTGDLAAAVTLLEEYYSAGRDLAAVFDQMLGLIRDALLVKTSRTDVSALISPAYTVKTLQGLCDGLAASTLIAWSRIIGDSLDRMRSAANRRVEAELCAVRLCSLGAENYDTLGGRVEALEEKLKNGVPVQVVQTPQSGGMTPPPPRDEDAPPPPGDEDAPPLIDGEPAPQAKPGKPAGPTLTLWPQWARLLDALMGKINVGALTNIKLGAKGALEDGALVILCEDRMAYILAHKDETLAVIREQAAKLNGGPIKVRVREAGDEIIQENNAKVDELIGHAQELDIEIKTL